MIRVFTLRSSAAAKSYYSSGLAREDYYSEGQEVIGRWHGIGAEKLELKDKDVTQQVFERLCDNQHPINGEQLTPRNDANRIIGFDLNFHAPKSLSLLQAINQDPRLVEAFRQSAAETLAEMETQTETRVRLDGAYEDRITGNLTWAEFVHFTARPVDGIPDPHLHTHNIVLNVTWDGEEDRWKAAKIREARQDLPMHQAAFHARLAKRVSEMGYAIQRTRQGWEILGISQSLKAKFSRRTQVIEAEAEKRGLTKDVDKDGLAALTREHKRKGLSLDSLRQLWKNQLSPDEPQSLRDLRFSRIGQTVTPQQAVDHALKKQFARDAVVRLNRVLAEAMRFGVGTVTPDQIRSELARRDLIIKRIDQQWLCTTHEVLAEEVSLITNVRHGKGKFLPLAPKDYHLKRAFLSEEQQKAVNHLLYSHDRILALRGGAGTGKTTAMAEVVEAIQLGGKEVFAFAPSASASRETLRQAGFKNANTVAHYLTNQKLQKQSQGQVIWVDEAGLLGTRDLWKLMAAAGPHTRIILTGDQYQHAPVARGCPFRVLQEFAGLKPAEITEIRRQKAEDYKSAVGSLAKGRVKTGFKKLDKMGAIREIADPKERYRQLAKDYLQLSTPKRAPLVVSPTHQEGRKVTTAIREHLAESGKLGKDERKFTRYQNLQWEVAERQEVENYREGLLVQYHQNGKGVLRGERFTVSQITEEGKIQVQDQDDQPQNLNLKEAKKFQIFEPQEINLTKGDLIRITRNGKSLDGRRQSNGQVRRIAGFTKQGDLKLSTGAVLSQKDGHFDYGYCQTSHSAQSKSVRDVLVAQSSESFPASSREQFYVSISRGKQSVRLYTDDRAALEETISGTESRQTSGLELAQFTSTELNKLMAEELNSHGWSKAMAYRRGNPEITPAMTRLLKERQSADRNKGPMTNWTEEMRKTRKTSELRGPNKSFTRYIRKERALTNPAKLKLGEAGTEMKNPEKPKKAAVKTAKKEPPKKRSIVGRLGGQSRYKTITVSGGHQIRQRLVKNRRQNGDPIKPSLKEKIVAKKNHLKTGLKQKFSGGLIRTFRGKAAYQKHAAEAQKKTQTEAPKATQKKNIKPVQTQKPKQVAKVRIK